jgi:hypothetical protein
MFTFRKTQLPVRQMLGTFHRAMTIEALEAGRIPRSNDHSASHFTRPNATVEQVIIAF